MSKSARAETARKALKLVDEPRLAKLSYRVDEACTVTGLSRPTLYRYIERGELRTFKVGTRTLIMASVLEAFLRRQAEAA